MTPQEWYEAWTDAYVLAECWEDVMWLKWKRVELQQPQ